MSRREFLKRAIVGPPAAAVASLCAPALTGRCVTVALHPLGFTMAGEALFRYVVSPCIDMAAWELEQVFGPEVTVEFEGTWDPACRARERGAGS